MAFATELQEAAGRDRRFLRTSPEFACKKLLAAGERRIVEFARVFRNRERGPLHHPEFTMVEWYRAHGRYELLIDDCMQLMACAADTVGARRFSYREPQRRSLRRSGAPDGRRSIRQHAGIDLLAALPATGRTSHSLLPWRTRSAFGRRATIPGAMSSAASWSEKIEPRLGHGRATVLYEYPAIDVGPGAAEDARIHGWLIASSCTSAGSSSPMALPSSTMPSEQRRRLIAQMDEKERIYGERYPIDEDFISAVRAMPPSCGVALGLERLVMLATGASHIDQVMWTPVAGL